MSAEAPAKKGLHLKHPLTPMLIVHDVAKSLDFYERALGMRKDREYVEGGVLWWAKASRGDTELMFERDGQVKPGAEARRSERPTTVLYFCVDNVPALLDSLKAKGIVAADAKSFVTGYGKMEITFYDPNGFEIRCAQEAELPTTE